MNDKRHWHSLARRLGFSPKGKPSADPPPPDFPGSHCPGAGS